MAVAKTLQRQGLYNDYIKHIILEGMLTNLQKYKTLLNQAS
jgi:hypothetical protein